MNEKITTERLTGMSLRTIWRICAVAWVACGLLQIASYAFVLTPVRLPVECVLFGGVLPLFLAGVWWDFARRGVRLEPWFHIQTVLAFTLIMGTTLLDVNDHSADAVYPMLPMVIAAVVLPVRHALPYLGVGAASAAAMVLMGQDFDTQRRAIVVGLIALTVGGIVIAVQVQVRRVVSRNLDLSETDELTGVANTRRLRQRLDEEFSREQRDGDYRLALLTIDLDDFKSVNDRFGHSTGDMVLIDTARAIESHIEPSDLVARRGGDEFSVLVLDRAQRPVVALAAEIGAAIARRREVLCPELPPSASIGLVIREQGDTVDRFLERGDHRLHEEKAAWHRLHDPAVAGGDTPSPPTRESHLHAVADTERPPARTVRASMKEAAKRPQSHDEAVRHAGWQIIAAYLFALGAIAPLLAAIGHGSDLLTPPVVTICYLAVIGSGICAYAAQRETRQWQIDLALVVMTGLTFLLIAFASGARNALIELLVGTALIACFATGRKTAAAFVAVNVATYGYALSTIPYENAPIRAAQTILVMLVLAGVVTRGLDRARAVAEENERLSGVDPLTGLANLRRLRLRLDDELVRSQTVGGSVTLFALDLDNFKQVNDTFGHTVGDEVLRAVAEALQREVRIYDLAARRGGDEFMVVMPHNDDVDLEAIARRLGQAVAVARASVCADLTPSASVGYVTNFVGEDAGNLIARADASEMMVKLSHRGASKRRLQAVA